MIEAVEYIALLPLLAIPALAAGAGGAGAAAGAGAGLAGLLGSVGGISGVLGSLPLIGGLFKKKGGSGGGGSMTGIANMINAQNITAVNTFKSIYGKAQTKSYIIYAVLGLVALVSLIYSFKKK